MSNTFQLYRIVLAFDRAHTVLHVSCHDWAQAYTYARQAERTHSMALESLEHLGDVHDVSARPVVLPQS